MPSWSVRWVWDQKSISGLAFPTQPTNTSSNGRPEEKSHSPTSMWTCQVQNAFLQLCIQDLCLYLKYFDCLITYWSKCLYGIKKASRKYFIFFIKDRKQGCVAMTTGVFAGLWDVVSCSNKEKYICKKPAEGVHVTTVPPTTPPLSCESGWTPISNRNICLKVRERLRSSLKLCVSDRIRESFFFFSFTHHKDFQKVLPAQEDLEGSPGLLQGHRWGPAELAQLKGPVQYSVLQLFQLVYVSCALRYSSIGIIRVSCRFAAFHYPALHGLALAWAPVKVLCGVMAQLYVPLY